MKIWPEDRWFSRCVKERAEWRCERCKTQYPEENAPGLDCSHFFGRRHFATRWAGDNAFAHCRGCHQYLGSNPHFFVGWVEGYLGQTRYEMLRERHNQIVKYTKKDRKEIAAHYKREYERMRQQRMEGHVGYLPFVDYE